MKHDGARKDSPLEPANILLVDDDPANMLALQALLEDLGQNLLEARSGNVALQRLNDEDFAVVLLDVQMPGLDGFETAKRIRLGESTRKAYHMGNAFTPKALPRKHEVAVPGFTLVELLVVIAIIGILIALLLPAVQAAREASRRSHCQNNLKQLSLGVLNYETSHRSLPPGGITEGPCCGTQSGAGWTIFILPFMEEQALFDKYDFDEPNESRVDIDNDGLNNTVVRETDLAIHDCPTDEETKLNDRPASGPGAGAFYNRGSYRGNAGLCTQQSGAFWDSSSQQNKNFAHDRGPLPGIGKMLIKPWGPNPNRTEQPNAPWSLTSPIELKEITDGTSSTMLLGEKSHLGKLDESRRRRTFWAYTYTSYQRSLTFLQTRSIISDYDRCLQIGGPFGEDPCKRSWGSLHAGGFNIGMCDGSIRFISESIDIFVFGAISTIAAGEVVQLE